MSGNGTVQPGDAPVAIHWFRRDLRIHDHPALVLAAVLSKVLGNQIFTPLALGVAAGSLACTQRGVVPAFTPIPRHDGAGDDLATLRRLNEGYVQAFRDANPAWYDAHMAADYVVTNSDGSFVDRAGALAAFSRPAFATHFLRFPVDQVNIRRFGDVALIEAENAWTMKDGRSGVSRYTDIWHKEKDGRWRCVSAHITPVTLP